MAPLSKTYQIRGWLFSGYHLIAGRVPDDPLGQAPAKAAGDLVPVVGANRGHVCPQVHRASPGRWVSFLRWRFLQEWFVEGVLSGEILVRNHSV